MPTIDKFKQWLERQDPEIRRFVLYFGIQVILLYMAIMNNMPTAAMFSTIGLLLSGYAIWADKR